MAEIWKPKKPEVYQQWLKAIDEEATEDLTHWEEKFLEDIRAKVVNGWSITQFQAEKLEEIYAEKTP